MTFVTWLCLVLLAVGVGVQLTVLVVRDQSAGATGWLEAPGTDHPAGAPGTYTFGWHRFRLGLRDGEPRLDLTRFTVVGHVEYRGRRFEFHSGRVRFSDVVWDAYALGWKGKQQLVADLPSVQDTTVRANVEIFRFIDRDRVRGGRNRTSGWAVQHHDQLKLTLRQRSPDGSWVVLARGS
jgi:hypothetical protein